ATAGFSGREHACFDFRLSLEAPADRTGFPCFEQLQGAVGRLDCETRALFRLLWLGETLDGADLERAAPGDLRAALLEIGLLERGEGGGWRTPDLLLVPLDSILVFVSTPPSYPTATRPAEVWHDLSSYAVAKSLPGSL